MTTTSAVPANQTIPKIIRRFRYATLYRNGRLFADVCADEKLQMDIENAKSRW